jgi:hypothetical protein
VRRFERLTGKRIAWAYFSNNWTKGIRFPHTAAARIQAAGTVPFIRLMARSGFEEGGPDRHYTLQRIIAGVFDAEIAEWGRAAAAQPFPLLVEFGTEVNPRCSLVTEPRVRGGYANGPNRRRLTAVATTIGSAQGKEDPRCSTGSHSGGISRWDSR